MMAASFAAFLAAVLFCVVTGHSLLWALWLGIALFSAVGVRRGHAPRFIAAMAWKKGRTSLIVVPVFFFIGMVTALWRSSGTIAYFLYYGLKGISPPLFLLMAFLLCALLSFALGTSFGVAGTAGVVLITMARSGGVDLALTAGAIVSGAYFGDRCSPMSSCAALVAACTGTELYSNVREMLRTAALPTVLAAAVYGVLSLRNPMDGADTAVLSALSEGFRLHWAVLLPAVLMLLLPLARVPVKWAMAASAFTALVLSVLLQGMPLPDALGCAVVGYKPEGPLGAILGGGGVVSMMKSAAIVFSTSLYAGILDGIDALSGTGKRIEGLVEKLGLFPATAIVNILTGCFFCNQSVIVVLGEQLMAPHYRRAGLSRQTLAMDIANSGVMLAGLIPWSIAISIPLSMLDVGLEAIPWCILLYLVPLCYLFTRRFFLPGQNPAGS